MSNLGLSHIEIYVSDLAASIDLWGWLLPQFGFSPYQEWDSGKSWRQGNSYITFVLAEEGYRDQPHHRKRPGLNHLAFWADSTDQVEALTRGLRERGVPILYEDRTAEEGAPSPYAVFFEDPDRMKVEVVVFEDE